MAQARIHPRRGEARRVVGGRRHFARGCSGQPRFHRSSPDWTGSAEHRGEQVEARGTPTVAVAAGRPGERHAPDHRRRQAHRQCGRPGRPAGDVEQLGDRAAEVDAEGQVGRAEGHRADAGDGHHRARQRHRHGEPDLGRGRLRARSAAADLGRLGDHQGGQQARDAEVVDDQAVPGPRGVRRPRHQIQHVQPRRERRLVGRCRGDPAARAMVGVEAATGSDSRTEAAASSPRSVSTRATATYRSATRGGPAPAAR